MSHLYKEARTCACGYRTLNRSNWCTHTKRCREHTGTDDEKEQLRERVASLEQQLVHNPVAIELRERVVWLEQQLLVKDEQLQAKDQRIVNLEQTVTQQLTETREELRRTKKRKDDYGVKSKGRKRRPELQRRRVAMRQNWRCANPDGKCILPGLLEAYDVDHILPLWKGGKEEPDNLQAICPACHRRKSDDETEERNTTSSSMHALHQPQVTSTDQ